MKNKNGARIWLCSICGKEITGDPVEIRSRGEKERHIHYECMRTGRPAQENSEK